MEHINTFLVVYCFLCWYFATDFRRPLPAVICNSVWLLARDLGGVPAVNHIIRPVASDKALALRLCRKEFLQNGK